MGFVLNALKAVVIAIQMVFVYHAHQNIQFQTSVELYLVCYANHQYLDALFVQIVRYAPFVRTGIIYQTIFVSFVLLQYLVASTVIQVQFVLIVKIVTI